MLSQAVYHNRATRKENNKCIKLHLNLAKFDVNDHFTVPKTLKLSMAWSISSCYIGKVGDQKPLLSLIINDIML